MTMASFANNASGHSALLAFLLQANKRGRVCLEASGNYSIDVALFCTLTVIWKSAW